MYNQNIGEREMFFWGKNIHLNKYIIAAEADKILDIEAYNIWIKSDKDQIVLGVAQTIQDIFNFEKDEGCTYIETLNDYIKYQKEKPAVSKQALLLALSYIPKRDS
jgi:hypothetical protein